MTVRALYLSVLGFCGFFSLHGCGMPSSETKMDPSDEVLEKMEADGHDNKKCMKKCTQDETWLAPRNITFAFAAKWKLTGKPRKQNTQT